MNYDFETLVQRRPANLKQSMIPEEVKRAGNVSVDGAEPDFRTAPAIEQAVKALAENGLYGFTLCDDTYRDRVVWWMEHARGTQIEGSWIIPTLGTIYSVATAIRLCTREGEGVIVMPPVYNRYEQAALRLYRKTVKCPLVLREGRYQMDYEALERAMEKKENKLLILCNPHNPTGQIFTAEELARLARLADRYGVIVFSEEIFADNCYQGKSCPFYLDIPGAAGHGIVSVSLGKAFHFTGVNHANILIRDKALREAFQDRRTRDHYGSIDPLVYESLVAAYTPEGLDWLRCANRYVEENIRYIREVFQKILPEVTIYGGEGGYILWMDWRTYFGTEEELKEFLYKKAYFHLDLGGSYGQEGFARMCVASPRWCIKKALGTLAEAAKKI